MNQLVLLGRAPSCEALLLLDAAGITLPATHLEQALHLLNEEIEVR